jgi:hypothetical protein
VGKEEKKDKKEEKDELSEVKMLYEKREKRNMEQLETVMESIIKYYKKSMKTASLRNQNSLELNINLEFKESFESQYIEQFASTKAYEQLMEECEVNDIKLSMKLKGNTMIVIKSKW